MKKTPDLLIVIVEFADVGKLNCGVDGFVQLLQ
ncbi:unnamed protein product [Schistocephalus solidus]|uniref:DUF190 domain-containing protein n=1 Tax=Schistocephalus solidus TaxID=70667 RepID=A0A183TSB4_SCHSO|nr:unnamed protein product [Schistocephalus solidus]